MVGDIEQIVPPQERAIMPSARGGRGVRRPRQARRIPDDILQDAALNETIRSYLPSNYNFEIHKTVWKARDADPKRVALQFPEGLLMYACVIADILERFAKCECVVLGDVTYGACCIDDLGAKALGCSLLVHYGHSCLVPTSITVIPCLYVFVEIGFDVNHLVQCVERSIAPGSNIAIAGTIQFASAVAKAREGLLLSSVPQVKPLSPGEVLGCTAPKVGPDVDTMVFVADGRFHLEAAMIQNPHLTFLRYDPYGKNLTKETYDSMKMQHIRRSAIDAARSAQTFGVILGTLGRQGSPGILDRLISLLSKHGKRHFVMLLSEIFPAKLAAVPEADAWVQVACPRLSIDWGHFFAKPVLTPYETEVCLGTAPWKDVYPMDFYSSEGGSWSNHKNR
jgi:2-(3-amino-3-carboxypropyl)histidine synthase